MANAVFAACGARMTQLPLTSERVQHTLANAERAERTNGKTTAHAIRNGTSASTSG